MGSHRANQHTPFVSTCNRVRDERFRHRWFLNSLVLRVADYAYDLKRGIWHGVGSCGEIPKDNLTPDCILFAEEFGCEGFVNHCDMARTIHLALGQNAAAAQFQTERR